MKHVNPYRIRDPKDFFDVGSNSSHPELRDAKRIWKFGGYTFLNPEAVEQFFKDEGLDVKNYVIEPIMEQNVIAGKNRIIINIVEKFKSRNYRALRELSNGNERTG